MSEMPILDQSAMVQRIYEDMYLGRGKNDPPVITRLDRIEQVLDSLKSWKWIMVASTLAMIGDIIAGHIK